jgi:hypothetical protein
MDEFLKDLRAVLDKHNAGLYVERESKTKFEFYTLFAEVLKDGRYYCAELGRAI